MGAKAEIAYTNAREKAAQEKGEKGKLSSDNPKKPAKPVETDFDTIKKIFTKIAALHLGNKVFEKGVVDVFRGSSAYGPGQTNAIIAKLDVTVLEDFPRFRGEQIVDRIKQAVCDAVGSSEKSLQFLATDGIALGDQTRNYRPDHWNLVTTPDDSGKLTLTFDITNPRIDVLQEVHKTLAGEQDAYAAAEALAEEGPKRDSLARVLMAMMKKDM